MHGGTRINSTDGMLHTLHVDQEKKNLAITHISNLHFLSEKSELSQNQSPVTYPS